MVTTIIVLINCRQSKCTSTFNSPSHTFALWTCLLPQAVKRIAPSWTLPRGVSVCCLVGFPQSLRLQLDQFTLVQQPAAVPMRRGCV